MNKSKVRGLNIMFIPSSFKRFKPALIKRLCSVLLFCVCCFNILTDIQATVTGGNLHVGLELQLAYKYEK